MRPASRSGRAHRVRWVLLKDAGLLSDVLTVFLQAVFALQHGGSACTVGRSGQCRSSSSSAWP
jgi:hypothetical protein